MNTCGTCKHFGELVSALDQYCVGEKEEDIPNTSFHKCTLLAHMNHDRPMNLTAAAGVIDGSGYYAAFCVSEEFGCNKWEPR